MHIKANVLGFSHTFYGIYFLPKNRLQIVACFRIFFVLFVGIQLEVLHWFTQTNFFFFNNIIRFIEIKHIYCLIVIYFMEK